MLDFGARRGEDLVPGNLVSLLIALERARSMEALAPLLRAMARAPEEGLRRDLFRWMLLLAARHRIELPPIEVGSSKALAEIGEWLLAADSAGDLAAKVRASIGSAAKH